MKHDEHQRTTMFIHYLAFRPQINNPVLRLLHILPAVRHHWRDEPPEDFTGWGAANNCWVGTCWILQRKCSFHCFLPSSLTCSLCLFIFQMYLVFNSYSWSSYRHFVKSGFIFTVGRASQSNLTSLYNCTVYQIHLYIMQYNTYYIEYVYVMYCCTFTCNV